MRSTDHSLPTKKCFGDLHHENQNKGIIKKIKINSQKYKFYV